MSRRIAIDVSPLRIRDFRLLFSAATVSSFGSMITYVSIPFQVKELTNDPLMVGLLGVCELVPLLLGFVGGALADYVDRRKLIIYSEIAFSALTLLLLVNALLGTPQLWLLFLIASLAAAIDAIQRPAMDAIIPRLAPAEKMPAVAALTSLRWQAAQIGAPTIAGLLIASTNMSWAYGFTLVTFAISLICLAFIRAVPPPEAAERPSLRSVVDGLRYAKSRPELLGTYLIDINAMFFAFPIALYPFLADKYGGPEVLGLFYAALGAGSLVVTLTSGWTERIYRHGLAVTLAAAVWGGGIVLFGVADVLWLALIGLFIAGGGDMVSGIFRSTIWNQTIPDYLRGRLASIEMLSYLTGPMLGQTRAGLTARWTGAAGSVVWGGALCIAGTVALAAALPAFLRYDGRDGIKRKEAEESARARAVAGSAVVAVPEASPAAP